MRQLFTTAMTVMSRRGETFTDTQRDLFYGVYDHTAELRRRKDELQFSIFAVLVDVGSSELSTLAQMSDRVTSVKKLSAEGTREIFLKI